MSLQTGASLNRSRLTRAPAQSSKPLKGAAKTLHPAVSPTFSNGGVSASTLHVQSGASNISLFLTNLRLLGLDLRPDWPDIRLLTFTKDAGQGQKKRVQCVEWALYQLFAIWDPEETMNTLRPFFPAHDQIQSLNLRAALLRALEHAKKIGVLGRDAVIRKTMLDECRGERFEEVLAVFSSTVLKKYVAEHQASEQKYHPAIAQTLALEDLGYSSDRTQLNALVLTHKVALSVLLKEKNAAREQFDDFADLLALKQRSLNRRHEQCEALEMQERDSGREIITENLRLEAWQTVRNNWSSNEQWMEALFYGDCKTKRDGLLGAPFDRVWRRVQSGRISELEDQRGGLLEHLERRVKAQRHRLQSWQAFRIKMFGNDPPSPSKKHTRSLKAQKGIDLGFGAHETLTIGRLSPRKPPQGKRAQLSGDYAGFLQGLQEELARINEGDRPPSFTTSVQSQQKKAITTSHVRVKEPISDISEIEDDISPPLVKNRKRINLNNISPTRDVVTSQNDMLQYGKGTLTSNDEVSEAREDSTSLVETVKSSDNGSPSISPTRRPTRTTKSSSQSPTRRPPSPNHISPPQVEFRSPQKLLSPTQLMADQILASMSAASPSPVKKPRHTLSLAERTRLSMARRPSHALANSEDEDDDLEPNLTLPSRRHPSTVAELNASQPPILPVTEDEPESEEQDLVARTRRSMAGFEAARQKAQMERRRSQRKSRRFVPGGSKRQEGWSVEEEEEGDGNTTLMLMEDLMGKEQDDCEAVFMSRPKIKTSPVGSPTRGGWED